MGLGTCSATLTRHAVQQLVLWATVGGQAPGAEQQ